MLMITTDYTMSSTRNIDSNYLCQPHLALQQQQITNNSNTSSISLSSSTSSLLSMYSSVDDLQQGFQPPPDGSQAYYGSSLTRSSSIRDNDTKTKSDADTNSSQQQPHGEFKATFYNPFETKHRRRTSRTQFRILEAAFEDNPKPSAAKRQSLAEELSMTARGVQIWFQNRRAKAKQQQQQQNDVVDELLSTSRKRQYGSEDNEKRQSHDSNNKRRVAMVHKRSAGKPLYTEWDSQEPIQQQHHSVTNEGQMHVTSSSPTSSHACNNSKNGGTGDNGITGIHPIAAANIAHTRLQQHSQTSVPPMCFTTDTSPSSSSSPIDHAFESPMTPSMSPTTSSSMYDSYPTLQNLQNAATASSMIDQQIYATTLSPSPCKPAWTSHHGFDEEAFPIESSFAYHHHPHHSTVSDWSPMSRSVSTPLLWQGSDSGDMQHNHHHNTSYLTVWASSTEEMTPTTTTPSTPTTVVSSSLSSSPSSCVQPPLPIGVATSDATAADENKNSYDDLPRFITAAVVDYSGTNISAHSSTPFDIRIWPELVSM